jgi:signal transduction histidine kinase
MLAHELRNPIGAAQFHAGVLLQRLDAELTEQRRVSGKQRSPSAQPTGAAPSQALLESFQSAAAIERSLKRASRLVDSVFDTARLIGHELLFDLSVTTELGPCVEGILDETRSIFGGREVRLDLPAKLPPLCTERVRLEQVLSCCLSNACRFTPREKPIGLRARTVDLLPAEVAPRPPALAALAAGLYVHLEIWDEGPGIPELERQHVFLPFYRLPTAGQQGAGLGLGLFICAGLVRGHSGAVWIDDQRSIGEAGSVDPAEAARVKASTVVHVLWPAGVRGKVAVHGRRPPRP